MQIELDEEMIKKIDKITITDYEIKNNKIPAENVYSLIEDLLHEIETLNRKYKSLEQEIEDNYRPISYKEQIDYNERDFY